MGGPDWSSKEGVGDALHRISTLLLHAFTQIDPTDPDAEEPIEALYGKHQLTEHFWAAGLQASAQWPDFCSSLPSLPKASFTATRGSSARATAPA